MTLYEIDQAILDCIDTESGEIIDAARLSALQMERCAKLEGIACWIKNLEADAEAYKAEKESFAARERAARNKAESLKSWLTDALQGEKLTTTKAAISFRRSDVVEIPNEELFVSWAESENRSLLTYKQPVPNKAAIKEALKSGAILQGAFINRKDNIQIK